MIKNEMKLIAKSHTDKKIPLILPGLVLNIEEFVLMIFLASLKCPLA